MTERPHLPATGEEYKARDYRPGRRTRIIDRRGTILPLCTPADLPAGAPRELHAAIKQANAHRAVQVAVSSATTAIIALAFYFVFLRSRGAALWNDAAGLLVSLVISGVIGALLGESSVAKAGREALAQCLHRRLCPLCCYDLSAAAASADGNTVAAGLGRSAPGPRGKTNRQWFGRRSAVWHNERQAWRPSLTGPLPIAPPSALLFTPGSPCAQPATAFLLRPPRWFRAGSEGGVHGSPRIPPSC